MRKTLKQRLEEGGTIRTFAIGRVVHPVVIEMYGLAGGFHGFWLDLEHAFISTEQMVMASLAAKAHDMDCFVRLAPSSYATVTQCLETGVGGVMAAQIQSADHAEQFVQWAKFAPRGQRGLNLSGRDANYTHKTAAQFIADANREHMTAIQIETLGSLADALPEGFEIYENVGGQVFLRRQQPKLGVASRRSFYSQPRTAALRGQCQATPPPANAPSSPRR